jgi:hypothetical protein
MNSINFFDEEGDVNPIAVVRHIWTKKILLLILAFLYLFFGYFVSNFMLEKKYTAESILTPVEAKQGSSGGLAGSQIGNMIGLSLGGVVGVNNAQIAMETLRAKDFFKRILDKHAEILPELVAISSYDGSKEIFNEDLYDNESKTWIYKPSFQRAWSIYNKAIEMEYSWDRGGFLTVRFNHFSPKFAAKILGIMIEEVNLVKRDRDVELANRSLDYLLRSSGTITNSELKRATSELMQNQLKIKMFADISPYYLVEPLDSIYVPESSSSPNVPVLSFAIALVLWIFSICIIVGRDLVREFAKRAS